MASNPTGQYRVVMKAARMEVFVNFNNDEYTLCAEQAEATLFDRKTARQVMETMALKAAKTGFRPANALEVLNDNGAVGIIEFQVQELDGSNFMQTFYMPKVKTDDEGPGGEVATQYVRTK